MNTRRLRQRSSRKTDNCQAFAAIEIRLQGQWHRGRARRERNTLMLNATVMEKLRG
jgi:hypothetical protein